MSSFYAFVILCFFVKVSFSIIPGNFDTQCPYVKIAPTFDVNRFLGRWYPIISNTKQTDSSGRCLTTDISFISNEKLQSSTNFMMSSENKTQNEILWINSDNPAKLKIGKNRAQDFLILEIDYDSFFIAYRCDQHRYASVELASIFTRKRNPAILVIEKALEIAAERSTINKIWFSLINQMNCP